MPASKENILYKPVSDYFLKQGFFVFSGAQKGTIQGTSEFGVSVPGKKGYETVDVLAVRWDGNEQIRSVAVECKLHGTARESAGAALDQATDYQLFFDEVYIATQEGDLGDKGSVLKNLGVGHIWVDLKSSTAQSSFPAQFRNADRFDPLQKSTQVIPRVVLPLIFRDVFSVPPRYMEAFRGLWVATNIVSKLQFNAGGTLEGRQTSFGVNVEFISDLRVIIKHIDRVILSSCLKALGERVMVRLGMDEPRTDRRLSEPIKCLASKVDVDDLLAKIKEGISSSGGRTAKPHLWIGCSLYRWEEPLTKQDYIARVTEAITTLAPVMQVFKRCFESEP